MSKQIIKAQDENGNETYHGVFHSPRQLENYRMRYLRNMSTQVVVLTSLDMMRVMNEDNDNDRIQSTPRHKMKKRRHE